MKKLLKACIYLSLVLLVCITCQKEELVKVTKLTLNKIDSAATSLVVSVNVTDLGPRADELGVCWAEHSGPK